MCPDSTVSLADIDEALKYALETRNTTMDSKKHIIDHFINELLDERSRLTSNKELPPTALGVTNDSISSFSR